MYTLYYRTCITGSVITMYKWFMITDMLREEKRGESILEICYMYVCIFYV